MYLQTGELPQRYRTQFSDGSDTSYLQVYLSNDFVRLAELAVQKSTKNLKTGKLRGGGGDCITAEEMKLLLDHPPERTLAKESRVMGEGTA